MGMPHYNYDRNYCLHSSPVPPLPICVVAILFSKALLVPDHHGYNIYKCPTAAQRPQPTLDNFQTASRDPHTKCHPPHPRLPFSTSFSKLTTILLFPLRHSLQTTNMRWRVSSLGCSKHWRRTLLLPQVHHPLRHWQVLVEMIFAHRVLPSMTPTDATNLRSR